MEQNFLTNERQIDVADLEQAQQQLIDQLEIAHYAQKHIYVLIDASLRDPKDNSWFESYLKAAQKINIEDYHFLTFDDERLPQHGAYLIQLNLSEKSNVELTRACCEMAWLDNEATQVGSGFRICGWITSHLDGLTLARRLGKRAIYVYTPTKNTIKSYFRYFDPTVLPKIWDILLDTQRAKFFDELSSWIILTRQKQLSVFENHSIESTSTYSADEVDPLALTGKQWNRIQMIEAINILQNDYAFETGEWLSREFEKKLDGGLYDAIRLGVQGKNDIHYFGKKMIEIDERFYYHPVVSHYLKNITQEIALSKLFEPLTSDMWEIIHQEQKAMREQGLFVVLKSKLDHLINSSARTSS